MTYTPPRALSLGDVRQRPRAPVGAPGRLRPPPARYRIRVPLVLTLDVGVCRSRAAAQDAALARALALVPTLALPPDCAIMVGQGGPVPHAKNLVIADVILENPPPHEETNAEHRTRAP